MREHFRGVALALMFPLGIWAITAAQDPGVPGSPKAEPPPAPADDKAKATSEKPVGWTTAVEPKPITPSVKRGLDWLVENQLKDGGWGQGDESKQMGGGSELRDKPNVADTSIAALALIRSGSTPSSGPYKDAVAKAVRYVRSQVESSDSASLDVSTVKGTRVQGKLGPNIDTFLASLFLAEAKGRMADPEENKTLDVALNKVIGKIKAHQKDDGTWDNRTGWAPILAQSMAGKGLNRAAQNGAKVDGMLLARAENYAKQQAGQAKATAVAEPGSPTVLAAAPAAGATDVRSFSRRGYIGGMGGGMGGAGSAGVELYDRASSLSVLSDSVNSNGILEADLKKKAETSKDVKEVAEAKESLRRFGEAKKARDQAQKEVVERLEDKSFVNGFGSNGGEEFLSYMNIGESLVLKGGEEWKKWDKSMTENLNRIQNDDGSWSGHHCITGRTFCSSTALLVLLSDRTPVPVQAKDKPADKK